MGKKRAAESPLENKKERKEHLVEFVGADYERGEEEESLSLRLKGNNVQAEDRHKQQFDTDPAKGSLVLPQVPVRISSREQLSPMAAVRSQTFDDRDGLRRMSTTGREGQNLITVSSTVASRLHKHWLRPCAACARTQKPESQIKKLRKKQQRNRNESAEKGEQTTDMYHRSISWIRKQEDKTMGLDA